MNAFDQFVSSLSGVVGVAVTLVFICYPGAGSILLAAIAAGILHFLRAMGVNRAPDTGGL